MTSILTPKKCTWKYVTQKRQTGDAGTRTLKPVQVTGLPKTEVKCEPVWGIDLERRAQENEVGQIVPKVTMVINHTRKICTLKVA